MSHFKESAYTKMFLTAHVLSPIASYLLQRALCFSVFFTCSNPIQQPQFTFQLFKNWSNFWEWSNVCPISFMSFQVQKQWLPHWFLPHLSSLFHFISPLTILSPLILPLTLNLIIVSHTFFSFYAVHSPFSVLPATLTHFGVLEDCLRCILYDYPYCSPSGGVGGVWDTGKVSTGVQPLVAGAPGGALMRMLWLVNGLLFCPEEAPWWPLNFNGNERIPPSLVSSAAPIICQIGPPAPYTNPEFIGLTGPNVLSHFNLACLLLPVTTASLQPFFQRADNEFQTVYLLHPQGHLLVLLLVFVLTNSHYLSGVPHGANGAKVTGFISAGIT